MKFFPLFGSQLSTFNPQPIHCNPTSASANGAMWLAFRWRGEENHLIATSMFRFAFTTSFCGLLLTTPLKILANCESGINLKGVYNYSLNQQDGSVFYSSQYKFDVLVLGCSWVIKYEQIKIDSTSEEPLDIGSVASCDGTNIYVVHLQNPDTAKKVWGDRYDSAKTNLPVALANIYLGTYPPPKEPVLQHLWLAFAASGCLLQASGGETKPPFVVDMAIFSDDNYKSDYHWVTGSDSQNFRRLILTTDGNYLVRDSKDGKILHGKYPHPFDKGYTNGIGSWLKATNIDNVSMPTRFEFTAFVPNFDESNSNSSSLFKACSYTCDVKEVGILNSTQIPVVPPEGKVLVSDRRFLDRGHAFISYPITGKWLALGDPFLGRLLQSARRVSLEDEALSEIGIKPSSKSNSPSLHSKSGIIRLVILCFMISPVCFFAAKLVAAKFKQKQK